MKGNRGNTRPMKFRKRKPNYNPSGWSAGRPFELGHDVPPAEPTAFEKFVAQLGNSPEESWHMNTRIKAWVHANKNLRYVPEFLLDQLGETVIDDTGSRL